MPERPPPGFIARAVDPARDVAAVFAVTSACDVEQFGNVDMTESDIREIWLKRNPETRARVIEDASGRIVGYGISVPRNSVRLGGSVYIHPDARGRGLGTWLTRWVESFVPQDIGQSPAESSVSHEFDVAGANASALELLENEGYGPSRYFWRMSVAIDAMPEPEWPAGITVRTFRAGDERAVYEADEESFADHWGHVPIAYEKWAEQMLSGSIFEPSLWFLAVEGEEIAGVSLCEDYPDDGFGWVNVLGVRRQWRKRGVALALLNHTFAEFYRRGRTRVDLSVDAGSLTGATRLYEKAGMRRLRELAVYAKEVRAGTDIATRAT
jgi:mycothiol synthase